MAGGEILEAVLESGLDAATEALSNSAKNNSKNAKNSRSTAGRWALGLTAGAVIVGGALYLSSRKKENTPQVGESAEQLTFEPSAQEAPHPQSHAARIEAQREEAASQGIAL